MTYLGIYDPSQKKTMHQKLDAAIASYWKKWERAPLEVLMHPEDVVERTDITVIPSQRVGRYVFMVGDGGE